MKEYREVRTLKQQIKKRKVEAEELRELASLYNREYSLKLNEIKRMEKELEHIRTSELKVTEHAILRYFERVLGFNISEIEEKLKQGLDAYEVLGNGTYPQQDCRVVVKDNHIITVINL